MSEDTYLDWETAIAMLREERDELKSSLAAMTARAEAAERERDEAMTALHEGVALMDTYERYCSPDPQFSYADGHQREVTAWNVKVVTFLTSPLATAANERREKERATTALEFYANADSYQSPSTGLALLYDPEPSPIQCDRGQIARAALDAKGEPHV